MHRQLITAALAATLTVLGGCKTTETASTADTSPIASNQSGYKPPFFNGDLLKGRVLIITWPGAFAPGHWLVDYAAWFNPVRDPETGEIEQLFCGGTKRRYEERTGGGRIGWDGVPRHPAAARWYDSVGASPVFYNPRTGRYHEEWWRQSQSRWEVVPDGWVQESWPRLMADACPELTERIVAAGVPINEAQTNPYIWRMLAQDPTAPYTLKANAFGADVMVRGKAASRSNAPFSWWHLYEKNDVPEPEIKGWPFEDAEVSAAPELTPEDAFIRTLAEGHGKVFTDPIGRAYVLSVHPDGDELWAIDDDDQLIDVGPLRFDAGTREVVLDWETLPPGRGYRYRVGDRLPVVNTDRTHPAFDLARHLASLEADQVLPFHGRQVTFRLNPDGTLLARRAAGDIAGTWRVSRGRIVLQVDGIPDRAGYPWAQLAELVGWTGVPMPDA